MFIVVAILAFLAAAVFLLIHAGHTEPYDAAERGQERRSATYSVTALHSPVDARTAALEAENAALRRQLEAPAQVTHNHLHLHGLSAVEAAELAAQRRELPMITQADQPW